MILIHGGGVTALACARLLSERNIKARLIGAPRPRDLVVLLGAPTLGLLAEIFDDPCLAEIGHPVSGRIVCQGEHCSYVDAPARSVPLASLTARLPRSEPPAGEASACDIQIDATGRRAALVRRLTGLRPTAFGRRHVVAVRLPGHLESAVMEVTGRGWVFAFPVSPSEVVVQAMVLRPPNDPQASLRDALAETRLLKQHVDVGEAVDVSAFPAAPAIFPVLASDRWLAVGGAAFAADPLCGDGVGVALHSAILATAVVSQMGGSDTGALIDHYHKRHQHSFAVHLRDVARYYAPLAEDPEWEDELGTTQAFLDGPMAAPLMDGSSFRYLMRNRTLVPTGPA